MAKVPNAVKKIAENYNCLTRVHERYRRQTDDRQTKDRQTDVLFKCKLELLQFAVTQSIDHFSGPGKANGPSCVSRQ